MFNFLRQSAGIWPRCVFWTSRSAPPPPPPPFRQWFAWKMENAECASREPGLRLLPCAASPALSWLCGLSPPPPSTSLLPLWKRKPSGSLLRWQPRPGPSCAGLQPSAWTRQPCSCRPPGLLSSDSLQRRSAASTDASPAGPRVRMSQVLGRAGACRSASRPWARASLTQLQPQPPSTAPGKAPRRETREGRGRTARGWHPHVNAMPSLGAAGVWQGEE